MSEIGPEIATIPTQQGEHKILGSLSILTEGKKGARARNVILVKNDEVDAEHPFRAIDPITEEEVKLSDTRLYDSYNALNLQIPSDLADRVGKYYTIRIARKRTLSKNARKAANK